MTKEELLDLKIDSEAEIESLYASFKDIMVYDEELCKLYDKEAIDTYLTSESIITHGYVRIDTIYNLVGDILRYFGEKVEAEKSECCELIVGDIAETFANIVNDFRRRR